MNDGFCIEIRRRIFAQETGQIEVFRSCIKEIEILRDGFRGVFAVVTLKKIRDQLSIILVRIPKQLGEDPGAEFAHFRPIAAIGALFENPAHLMGSKKSKVRAESKPDR